MITNEKWTEFRSTGLLLFINQILHVFGWAILCEINENGDVTNAYPDRVKFRGFDNEDVSESYVKISKYLNDNSEILLKESEGL